MRKSKVLLMMFASLTLVVATSCGKNDPEPPKLAEITLSVSGGTEVTVMDGDVTKDVTVSASAEVERDVVVMLSSPATEAGDASFESSTITIKQGEKSAVGKIVFPLSKFPEGADAKKITVTIATSAENVTLAVASTEFSVKGNGGKDMPKLKITANGTEFDTTDDAKTISLTCTLSEVLAEALPITLTLGSGTSENIKAMFPEIQQIIIAAGQTTFTLPFEMPKGTVGKIVADFAVSNDKVTLETQTLSAVFVVNEPEINPTFALETTQTGDVIVPATGDKIVSFTVKLSKTAEEEQVINLSAGKGVLSASSVTFAVGETSKDVTITFLSSEFTSDAVTADVVITGTSQILEATAATITLKVKGTATTEEKQDLQYYLGSDSGSSVVFLDEDALALTLWVRTDAVQTGDIKLNVGVTGIATSEYTLTNEDGTPLANGVVTTTAEDKFKRFKVVVKKSAIGKTVVVAITSNQTTISDLVGSLSFPVSLSTPPVTPFDYQVTYNIENKGKNVTVTNTDWIALDLVTNFADYNLPSPIFLTTVVTGGLDLGVNLGVTVKMLNQTGRIWLQVANFNELPNGATGTLSFTSIYTTIADNTPIMFTVSK